MNNLLIKRLFAFIIDLFVINIIVYPIILFNWDYILRNSGHNLLLYSVIITFLPYFLYFFFTELLFEKTLGKKILRLEVYVPNNKWFNILIRNVCRFIPFDPISFLFDKSSFWHDKLSNTSVILQK